MMAKRTTRNKGAGGRAGEGAKMGSTFAAMAFSAFAVGTPNAPAQASIPPLELAANVRTYRIPAGTMAAALNSFADKNGLHLLYDARETRRLKSAGLSGAYSVREGLDRLLAGTGLTYRFANMGDAVSIVLAQNDAGAQSDAGGVGLPAIDVEGNGQGQGGPGTGAGGGGGGAGQGGGAADQGGGAAAQGGGRFTGYSVPNAVAATKTDAPILQTPVAIQVVPRQTMDDQQAITVQDAIVSNVSSVSATTFTLPIENFTIRGFASGENVYINGLRQYSQIGIETQNLQSIEVLKGPSAVLYGRVEAGGLVDLVLKRPLDSPYYSFQEQAGSFGFTRTTFDLTAPLTADHTWLYRINGDFLHADSFVDYVTSQNIFIAPTITYHPIEQFKMNVDVIYQRKTLVDDSVFPAVGSGPAQIPISRYLEQPSLTADNPSRMDNRYVGYDWKFDINPDWSLTNRFYYQNAGFTISQTPFNTFPAFLAFNQATGAAHVYPFYENFSQQTIAGNVDLKGKFDTGPLKHSVLFGTDYFNLNQPVAGINIDTFSDVPTNIYFPSYHQLTAPTMPNTYATNTEDWKGVYAQDMISTLNDTVHLLIGARYDWANIGGSFVGPVFTQFGEAPIYPGTALAAYQSRNDQAFDPRVGLVYQPQPWLSFYGNFAQSFGTNLGFSYNPENSNGSLLNPSKATQWEGGVKAEFFDKRLSATLAFYDITKTNIETPDPEHSGYFVVIGAAESKGVEVDVTGRVNQNWSLIANYSYDDARVTAGSPYIASTEISTEAGVVGNRLPSVPLNQGNLWVKYDADGDYTGLSVAGGLNVVGSVQGDNANSFQLPQYTLVNGMIAYRFPWAGAHFTAQLNVKNIFDATYYAAATTRYDILPGTPRTILASLRVEF